MEYPATQMFVNDDDDEEEGEDTDEDAGTPLRSDKNVKVGTLLVDSATYPVHRGINRVGRIESCSIVIDHNTISKEHAEIEAGLGAKSTFIVDMGSMNKTKLNDAILRPGRLYQLQDGDVVRFGSVRAVFKLEETRMIGSLVRSNNSDGFVIPESPAPIAKEVHPMIPGTPDLSFDRSLTEVNRSSDVSVIAGTQDVENTASRSSGFVRGPNLDPDRGDNASETSVRIDRSDLETQKNSTVEDSDEENIFDMMTQKTDIHDDETQRFSTENLHTVKSSRYSVDKIDSHSSAVEDLETQKFFNDDGGVAARLESINDLETQKFTLQDVSHGSRRTVDGIETHVDSINDLETQMFTVDGVGTGVNHLADKIQSINDVETQKFEAFNNKDSDSETDEEGIFENSDDAVVDMFDAPTQLIRAPREVSKSPCQVEIENVAAEPREEEKIEQPVAGPEENEERNREAPVTSASAEVRVHTPVEVKTDTELEINEEKRATLNDSIESKLNHMFDDVNESAIDEPTQMLTQHLENILESTQVDRSGLQQRKGDTASVGNADLQPSKLDSRDGGTGEIHDDNTAKSDEPVKVPPKKTFSAVIRVPKLLSSQELFGDLPAVNIYETPSARSNRGRIKLSPLSEVTDTPRSKKMGRGNTRNFADSPKRTESTESGDSVNSKHSNSAKDTESMIAESEITPTKKGQQTPKSRGRKKPRIQNEVVSPSSPAGNLQETSPKIEEPMTAESRKGLPLKKRGSSILSSPPTPQKTIAEVVTTVRVSTRSNMKISVETGKRSTRLSAVDSPKVQESSNSAIRGSPEKPESSTTKNEPSNRNKKNTRSKIEDASSSSDQSLETEIKPQPMSSPSGNTRRLRKKPLDTSAAVTPGEVTPVKRARISITALPSNVNDRPRPVAQRETRKNVKPREVNLSDSSEIGINQNESLPTRSRRGRLAAKTSTDNSKNSSLATENLSNISHQSSLESQEIQAILGVVDQGDNEARGSGVSRYRKEVRVFPSHMTGNDFRKVEEDRVSSRQGFIGFTKAEISKRGDDLKEEFERPMGRGERKKRLLPRPQIYEDEDLVETSRKRPNLRGKKNADVVNKDDSLKPETSCVIVATGSVGSSNLKSQGKSTKKEKIATENVKAKDQLPPEIVVEESTPKSRTSLPIRNKRGTSHKVVDQPGKENVVEESPPRRGRKKVAEVRPAVKQNSTVLLVDDEDKVSESSSPLRRGRSSLCTPTSAASSSAKMKHKILFTGLNSPRLVSIVNNLGGTVTEKPNDCTALVTDKVRRTYKFLCCMAMAVPIVSLDWLKESDKRGRFLETGDFVLKDAVEEAKFGFNLRRSLVMATGDKLLEGYTVVLTPGTAPPPIAEMKGIIQACGGKALARPPARWAEKSLIISRQEDIKNAKKFLTKAPKSVRLLSVEFILTGILRHELNFDEHKLEID